MRLAFLIILLIPVSCKPTQPESYTSNAVVRGPPGSMDITVTTAGVMSLVPGEGEKLTKIASVAATLAVVKDPVVASTTPVPIGTISLGKVAYELNGKSTCTRDFVMEMVPACSQAAEPGTQTAASVSPNFAQVASPLADMVCAAHGGYQTKIWQKQFRVALAGGENELAEVKEVKYTVWSSYGKTFTGTNAANKFDSGSTFLTLVTTWDIDAAIAVMKDGREFPIPEATLTWNDDVPNKKAATPCE